MNKYRIDPERGFLPTDDPAKQLTNQYHQWDELGNNLTRYINAGIIREKVDDLTLIENPDFESRSEWERAMLLLSFFAHAYVHSPPEPVTHIPASIAIPWVKVANTLGRKPVLSHASIVLNNWQRLDDAEPIELDNLSTICQFHGGLDESWFYLVTVQIEQTGAKAIPKLLDTLKWAQQGNYEKATETLRFVNTVLKNLTVVLKRMYESCDPYIFYHRVRPFLASFEDIDYRGTGLELQNHHGGSAAQSSLLQFFDAALGIRYEDPSTNEYLQLMRQHMPQEHADFLNMIEKETTLPNNISKSQEFENEYYQAINHLVAFRNEHLKMVSLYIMKQAKHARIEAVGTGGTNPMVFLKSVRNQGSSILP